MPIAPCDTPVTGAVTNSSFESGSLSGWELHYKKMGLLGVWKKTKPTEHPAAIATTGTPLLAKQGLMIPPYDGAHMARLNDLSGGCHATRIRQYIVLPTDISACSCLRLQWGAMLEDGHHDSDDQPQVEVEVKRKAVGWKIVRRATFHANDAAAAGSGWVDIKQSPTGSSIWYKHDVLTIDLGGMKGGTKLRVSLEVRDCTHGEHGGAAFLDAVEIVDRCANGCTFPPANPIPDLAIPNVFTPNGDGVNDAWMVPGLDVACRVDVLIKDRWGVTVHQATLSSTTGLGSAALWDGRRKSGKRIATDKDNPYFYVLEVSNCTGQRAFTGYLYVYPCKAAPVISDPQERRFKLFARLAAKADWSGKARSAFGSQWRHWARAHDQSFAYTSTGKWLSKKWTCVASARPCPR